MIQGLVSNRFIVAQLIRRDFKSRYIGSMFGFIWAFLQPLAMMTILWVVFEFGLKAQVVDGRVPFVAWFFAGMVAWNFFADALGSNTNVFIEYSYLLKKMEFRMGLLPLVKLGSGIVIHLIFLFILGGILWVNGISPSWYWLNSLYYLGCLVILLLGLGWFTAAIQPFWRDMGQIISIFIQFGFWATPIMWEVKLLPPSLTWLVKLNPLVYIIDGYRNAFLYEKGFWDHSGYYGLFFWSFTLSALVVGRWCFLRMRPHFGDVL